MRNNVASCVIEMCSISYNLNSSLVRLYGKHCHVKGARVWGGGWGVEVHIYYNCKEDKGRIVCGC